MLLWFSVFLFLVTLVLLYVYVFRPLLVRWGAVQPLPPRYQNATDRLASFVRWSFTMVWGWICSLAAASWLFAQQVAEWIGDPNTQAQIQAVLVDHPVIVGVVLLFASAIFMVGRFRTAYTVQGTKT